MELKLNNENKPAAFTQQTHDKFEYLIAQLYDNKKLGIEVDNICGPLMTAIITQLLEEGCKLKGKEIDFVWEDVFYWIKESEEADLWQPQMPELLTNFYYFQNAN